MCGRYTLKTPSRRIAEAFDLPEIPDREPRFNIAPTQLVLIVRNEEGERVARMVRWGLIPFWAKDPSIGNKLINARSETVAEKPAFRHAFQKRRCLVIADGFYEWEKVGKIKQPWYYQVGDGGPFAFAGLWERWDKGEEPLESCTILTTLANLPLARVYERMPVILPPEVYDIWLGEDTSARQLQRLLTAYSDSDITEDRVSSRVNSPKNDDAELIRPLPEGEGLGN